MMFKFAVLLFCIFISALSAKESCGTARMIAYLQQSKAGNLPAARTRLQSCPASAYYDSILTKTTAHFAIFYTMEGPHATTQAFVDSLAVSMEAAYSLFTNELKTLAPKGFDTTYQFRKPVPNNLYAIEVAEISMVRNVESLVKDGCDKCFGLTVPNFKDHERSTILIDNDFRYSEFKTAVESFRKDSMDCPYYKADASLQNLAHDYSYAKNFGAGLRITSYHELYHAIQTRYFDFVAYHTFWLEASASAIEEIGAPDVDDYFAYLNPFFGINWDNLDEIEKEYSIAPLFLAMYNSLGKTFDTKIWESYSKAPDEPFENHFATVARSFNKNGDSLFHTFAERLYFSGDRFKQIKENEKVEKIHTDQIKWPTVSLSKDSIRTKNHPYFTYQATIEYPQNVAGMVSYILKKGNDIEIIKIKSQAAYRSYYSKIFSADSSILVYSNLNAESARPDSLNPSKFYAYPNPWKANTPLCFNGLPNTKNVLEIRTRRGSLVNTFEYNASEFCISESEAKKLLAPGLYYYRAGRSGKTEKLLVVY